MEHVERKTTILLGRELHHRLVKLAKITRKSMGQLLREAAERQYFSAPDNEKAEIVRKMAAMRVPVGSPKDIAAEILKGRLES